MVNDAYFKICYIDLNTDELFDLKSSAQNDNARPFGDYVRRHISERLPDPVQAAAFSNQLSAENIKAAFDADSGNVEKLSENRAKARVTANHLLSLVNDDTVTVRFTIEDTGVGMSEEFQKKMFEPFT